jgi:HYDIN/CFA65/VesB family protein
MRRRLPVILSVVAMLMLSSVAVSSATSGPAAFQPSPVNFGSVPVGSSGDLTVTVTNNGDTDMTVNDAGSDVVLTGANPGAFGKTNDNCASAVVPSGQTCTLHVTFSPSSAQGYSATLTLVSDSQGPDQVDLNGTGTPAPAPAVSISPASDGFGNQKVGTTSGVHTFTVTNSGDTGTTLHIAQVSMASGSDSAFSIAPGTDHCSGNAAPCTVGVTFSPASEGDKAGNLSVTSSDQGVSPGLASLTGTGTVPQAQVSPPVNFATPLNVPQTLAVTLKNVGQAPMNVQGSTLSGSDEFSNTGNGNCGNTVLQPGDTCSAQIQFLPTAGGAAQGSVSFADDASDSPQQVQLSGTVLVPGIQVNPTSVAFGDLVAGHLSATRQVTITNTGGANLHISAVTIGGANPGAFKLISQTCTANPIAPNGSCVANVAFSTTRTTSRVATLTFVNNAGPDQSVALTGQGTSPPDATGVTAASGCSDVKLTWQPPDGAQYFRKIVVVRKSKSYPTSPGDGQTVKHSGPSVVDTAPKQFHTYRYTIFARYTSYNGEGRVYSTGVHVRAHTGRICAPRNNGETPDLTPKVDWTAYTGTRSYAFILQHNGRTIWVHYVKRSQFTIPSSWSYNRQEHSLARGNWYDFYLYSYTRRHPNGVSIGHNRWLER